MKHKPLDELEMFELMRAAYPERFTDDEDETWDAVQDFVEELSGSDDIADLLGRVVMLTMPAESPLTGTLTHALGTVTMGDGKINMIAAVHRRIE